MNWSRIQKGRLSQMVCFTRPFKINCLFCLRARVAFAMSKTKTQTVDSTHYPENRTFFGLKIRRLEAEQIGF